MTFMKQRLYKTGLSALISIVLLASGTLAFALVTMAHTYSYVDMVMRRELRIQSHLSLEGCIESIRLMSRKDIFLKGDITIREFGCHAHIENDYQGNTTVSATSTVSGVNKSISLLKL
jgi:hypothetical protein